MRTLAAAVVGLCACSSPSKPPARVEPAPAPVADPVPAPAPAAPQKTTLAADTPETTAFGNNFVAPGGWTFERRGDATIIGSPEPGSYIALVDVRAADADAAVAAAWLAYKGAPPPWKIVDHADSADKDGWSKRRGYAYDVPPNAKRAIGANAMFANGSWLVMIIDLDEAIAEKRGAQLAVIVGKLLPKGHERESFAGRDAHELDATRVAELTKFVATAETAMLVPGVAVGIVQHGKIVFAGGIGVRDLGKPAKVDANTKFMIASNTKQLTTLMLAKLVDANKLTWETAVTSLLPTFKLGTDEVTKQVHVKHLICACTGLPRQDLEWILNFKGLTPEDAMATLGTVQPTSKFGEMFQYSNLLAAAGGFVGGHVEYPKLELGAAYDKAMQTLVFDPLGMSATTFDYARALRGDHAAPHGVDVDGKAAHAPMQMNYAAVPVRPAGAAWSTVNDLLKYVSMELAKGKLPSGKVYISEGPLLERRVPQVPIGKDATYGMGLMVDTTYGVTVVHHGGDVFGYHSDLMWLPDQDIGAVILTNGDGGSTIRDRFRRKLLEVLFDGNPEADAAIAADGQALVTSIAAERKLLVIPADPAAAGKLAPKFANKALGGITVTHAGDKTFFDFGPLKTEVATKANPDGTVSFVTIAPGFVGFELVVAGDTLVVRDAQHEYVYEPVK
jgi:CubicO group peptidase (beta-lactamase class C family)